MTNRSEYSTKVTGLPAVTRQQGATFFDELKERLPHGALGVLGAVASIALFGVALYIIGHTLSEISYADLVAAIGETSARQVFGALALTALSYLFLTGYDVVALRHIRVYAPYRVSALASFASCAISFNLGFPIVTSAAVRFWIYGRAALTAVQVATVTVFAGVTFWLGMALIFGVGLATGARALSELDHLPELLHFLAGVLICASVAGYCVWTALARRHIRLRGLELELPSLVPTLAQIALSLGDICCAAGALYLLLPANTQLDFAPFVAVYVGACILGVISHAPGGIGVFEAVMLNAIPSASREDVLASLLMFRVIYYFLPFIVALALLGADEASRRWESLRDAITRIIEQRAD